MLGEEFIAALSGDDWTVVANIMHRIEKARQWPQAIAAVAQSELAPCPGIANSLQSYWTERGFRVRAQVANDALVLDALWRLLPRYKGPGLTLYRGEVFDRWQMKKIGFGWTPRRDVAVMFARGLAASEGVGGGILLRAEVKGDAIIAGSCEHSLHLGEDEYTVDPRRIDAAIVPLKQFPHID